MPALDDKGNIIQREILSLDASHVGCQKQFSIFNTSRLFRFDTTHTITKDQNFTQTSYHKGPIAVSVWLHLSGAAYIFSFSQSGSYFNHRVPFNEETLNQVSRSKVKVVVHVQNNCWAISLTLTQCGLQFTQRLSLYQGV